MGLIEWIAAILGGIAINLVASELFAWGPRLSESLTRWAVRRLPVEMQERMREEWAGHLDALHPLSRMLAAIGFVLAAYRIRVSFNRNAKGALTLRQWLSPRPIIVVIMTEKLAMSMAHTMRKAIDAGEHPSDAVGLGAEEFLIRLNLVAQGRKLLRHLHKRALRVFGKELTDRDSWVSDVSGNRSREIVVETTDSTWLFRIRSSIRR